MTYKIFALIIFFVYLGRKTLLRSARYWFY